MQVRPHEVAGLTATGQTDAARVEILDVMGPRVQLLNLPRNDTEPCLISGTTPLDVFTHPDPETFVHLSGELEGLRESGDVFGWVQIAAADIFHVPGGAKHAFRNHSRAPAVSIVVTTPKLGRFFRDAGVRVGADQPGSA
jgi:hypothetical protein